MTENDFNELFGTDAQELAAKLDAAAAEHAAEQAKAAGPKEGLWYVEDTQNGDGHAISWYRLAASGKTLLWFSIDNELVVDKEAVALALGGELPAGVTAHVITVWNADRSMNEVTTGYAMRAPHGDGTGVHIDGTTVRSYVLPRAIRWIAGFYGV